MNNYKFEEYYSKCFDSKDASKSPVHEIIEDEVFTKINEDKRVKFNINFSAIQIKTAILQLNKGKAFGYDNVSAKMLIYSDSQVINPILAKFYSAIYNYNLIPENFNVSMVTPIPKSKEIPKNPSNFRPISVSTVFANVFELLLLDNGAENLKKMSKNQFGYQKNLSSKRAYFVIKECIYFYNTKNEKLEIAQLDAEKAFDTLWRTGLYHKLMNELEPVYFRPLTSYYKESKIIVRYNGESSKKLKRTME